MSMCSWDMAPSAAPAPSVRGIAGIAGNACGMGVPGALGIVCLPAIPGIEDMSWPSRVAGLSPGPCAAPGLATAVAAASATAAPRIGARNDLGIGCMVILHDLPSMELLAACRLAVRSAFGAPGHQQDLAGPDAAAAGLRRPFESAGSPGAGGGAAAGR